MKDGQCVLGTFDEITAQGFDVDEILQQYGEMGRAGGDKENGEDVLPLTVAEQLLKEQANEAEVSRRKLRRLSSIQLIRSATKIIANEQLVLD